jgi:hypothetical protein
MMIGGLARTTNAAASVSSEVAEVLRMSRP